MGFQEVGGVGAKISLMPSILLDKNCTQQNGILGEPRKIGNGLYIWQLSSEEGKLGSSTAAWICRAVAAPEKSVSLFLTNIRDLKKWFKN